MSKNTSKNQKTQPYEKDLAKLKKSEVAPQANNTTTEKDLHDEQPDHQQIQHQQSQEAIEINAQMTKSHHSEGEEGEEEQEEGVPSEKDKLIEYLKETLKRAEMTMGTIFVAIQIEKDKRGKLVEEITEKKTELVDIHTQENNYLTEKVSEKMATALQRALADKETAENEFAESQQKMEDMESTITELDENIQNVHIEKSKREAEVKDNQYRVNEQESMIDSFNNELEILNVKNSERAKIIDEMNVELGDMKGIIESLINVRGKLNHYLKDETPSPSRKGTRNDRTPQDPSEDPNRTNPALWKSGEVARGSKTHAKPNMPPSDDDFWYGEAKSKQKASNEQRRPEGQETWQPKVQYYDMPPEGQKTSSGSLGGSPVKLPSINAGRPEYLYKNKEHIDEFESGNQKSLKKGQQQNRRVY